MLRLPHHGRSGAAGRVNRLMDCIVVSGLAMATLLALTLATRSAAAQDYPGFPYTIMAPERGAGVHRHRTTVRRGPRSAAATTPIQRHAQRNYSVFRGSSIRGSSGVVLPTPLPRTPLIPPEGGGGAAATRAAPQQQGPTFVPGLNAPVPNLPHGAETFQDRAARCAFQQGLYGVPGNTSVPYMAVCVQ